MVCVFVAPLRLMTTKTQKVNFLFISSQSSTLLDSGCMPQSVLHNWKSMELLSIHDYRVHSKMKRPLCAELVYYNLIPFQCSFIPKFHINIQTRYENNKGTTENVRKASNVFENTKILKKFLHSLVLRHTTGKIEWKNSGPSWHCVWWSVQQQTLQSGRRSENIQIR